MSGLVEKSISRIRIAGGTLVPSALLAILAYLVVSRFPFVALSLRKSAVFAPAEWQAPVADRFLGYGATVLFWWSAARFLRRKTKDRFAAFAPTILLGAFGWGMLLLLLIGNLGVSLGRFATAFALIAPLAGLLIMIGRNRAPEEAPPAEAPARVPGWIRWGLLACLVIVALKGFDAFLWLPLRKGPAQGDEAFFWWSSLRALKIGGWTTYLTSFQNANYDPGYPLLGNLLIFWAPPALVDSAGLAVPFLYGAMAFWILGAPLADRRPRAGLWTWTFFALLGALLFFYNSWIERMTFQLWYAEILGVVAVAASLICTYGPVLDASGSAADSPSRARKSRALLLIECIGVGALARLSKPPLSVLLLPAVIPALLIGVLAVRRDARRGLLERIGFFALGSVLAQLLWTWTLKKGHFTGFYQFRPIDVLKFDWEAIRHTVVPYFFGSYKHVWLVFGLSAALALVTRPGRHLGPLLVAGGLALSIFLLYGSVWKTSEYESSLRYLLHGMYGWTLYYFVSAAPWIDERFERVNTFVREKLGRKA